MNNDYNSVGKLFSETETQQSMHVKNVFSFFDEQQDENETLRQSSIMREKIVMEDDEDEDEPSLKSPEPIKDKN